MRIAIYSITSVFSTLVSLRLLQYNGRESGLTLILCIVNLLFLILTTVISLKQMQQRKKEESQFESMIGERIALNEKLACKGSEYYKIQVKLEEIFKAVFEVVKKIKQEVSLSFVFSEEVKNCVEKLLDLTKKYHANIRTIGESVAKSKESATDLNNKTNEFKNSINDLKDDFSAKYMELNQKSKVLLTMKDKIVTLNTLTTETIRFMDEMGSYAAEEQLLVNQITTDADQVSQRMEILQEAIQTINDVTEKTRLLSINAMIEATKVDTQSKRNGFKVVAYNIRELSNNSQHSINKIIKEIPLIVKAIMELISKFKRSAEIFNSITRMISKSIQLADRQGIGIKDLLSHAEGINAFILNLSSSFKNLNNHFAQIDQVFDVVNEKSGDTREMSETVAQILKDSIQKLELIYNNIIIIDNVSKASAMSLQKVDQLALKFKV